MVLEIGNPKKVVSGIFTTIYFGRVTKMLTIFAGNREHVKKSKESVSSKSLLKSKPKPVVIGEEVIGQPLAEHKRNSCSSNSSHRRRSSRPSTSQYR